MKPVDFKIDADGFVCSGESILPMTVPTKPAGDDAAKKPQTGTATAKKTTQAAAKKYSKRLPGGIALTPADVAILKRLNAEYAHTVIGGKNVVVGQRTCQVQGSVYSFELLDQFTKRFLHRPFMGDGDKKKQQGQAWLEWPDKNYKPGGVGFYPDPRKCPPDTFNLFRGFQVQPVEGDCTIYLDHLKYIICAGDELVYRYLICWIAHMIQKPDEKPSVAVVLKSVEGTGKGTMAETLLIMLGPHGNKTNGAFAVSGRFNATLVARLFIFIDEADLTDRHTADKLKGLISETSVNLERKGIDIEPLPNYCRFIFASNHTRVLNAGIRERRYLVLEPSDEKAQDTAYFSRLWAWINDGGAAKFLDYLLKVDISDFNPYKCPQTKALIAEKLANLSSVNRFFYDEIIKPEPFGGRARVYASGLVDEFMEWSIKDDSKISTPAARSLVGVMMGKLNIPVQGRSDRDGGKFYDLPERAELMQAFAALLDIPENELDK